jgi:hypothetical protein
MSFETEPIFVTVQSLPPPKLLLLLLPVIITVITTALTRLFGNLSKKARLYQKEKLVNAPCGNSVHCENGMRNKIQCVDKFRNFLILEQVTHAVTTVSSG